MANSTNTLPEIDRRLLVRGIIRVILFIAATSSVMFLAYGGILWPEAWALVGLGLIYFLWIFLWGVKHNPGVLNERSKGLDDLSESWDKVIVGIYSIAYICMYTLAGLDAGRFGWSGISPATRWVAFLFVLPGYILPMWAVSSNPFASGVVHIQEESGHHVVSQGPYRFIRHPMYLGILFYGSAIPVFLGSWWALVPGGIILLLFIIRTAFEDRMLQERLPGYREYAGEVRYKLVPGVW
jgi:protein-S-isoprenylcysteine O-methyltransferase Ste14